MILIKNIKSYQPLNFILLIILAIVSWSKTFINNELPGVSISQEPMPVYEWIYGGIASYTLLCKFIAFLIVIIQAFIINGVTNLYNLLGFRSYLPGIFFILITANFPSVQVLQSLLFANLFLLTAWERISSITEASKAFSVFFNASLFVGISTIFYPNYIYFLIMISLAPVLNRISHPREFGLIILGFLLVWYFYLSASFVSSGKIELAPVTTDMSFSFKGLSELELGQLIFIGYAGFLLTIASFQLGTYMTNVKIIFRRNLKFLFAWFVIANLIYIFTNSALELIYVIAVPVSMLFSLFFQNLRYKWLAEVAWILLLLISTINQFFSEIF